MNFTVAADFYGHGYQTDTLPTAGSATTVVYSNPVQANIADFTEDKTDFYFGPHKVFNEANFTDNSSDWDTAYGWGDHASAGYLTSHQDISGKLDKSGGTMTGQLTIEGTSPQMKFVDTGDHDDFWIHVNSNRFYVLPDQVKMVVGKLRTPSSLIQEQTRLTRLVKRFGMQVTSLITHLTGTQHMVGVITQVLAICG